MSEATITILGSGDTLGTPLAGCKRAACLDTDPKSRRYRFGLLLRLGETTILVDPNPDLKWQCLDNNFELKEIDHILVTHHHSDHINGLGEFFYRRAEPTKLWYGDHPLNHKLIDYWRYLESEQVLSFKTYQNYQPLTIGEGVQITPVELNHGFPASGFVVQWQGKKIGIVTDTNARLSQATLDTLWGADVLFVDTFSENLEQVSCVYEDCSIETPDLVAEWFHMTLPEVKELQAIVQARRVYTVHMSRHMAPHQQLAGQYQTDRFIIGFDGLTVFI